MQKGLRIKKKRFRAAMYMAGVAFLCAALTLILLVFRGGKVSDANQEASEVAAVVEDWSSTVTSQLWVVNDKQSLPFSYEPELMVSIRDSSVMLVNEAATAFALMVNAMEDPVIPANGYISASAQQNLYETKKNEYREQGYSEERVNTTIRGEYMPGGKDEHQLGLTVDVCADTSLSLDYNFQNTLQGKWLLENAWRYGFVFRDQGETEMIYKPWQLRYVGKVHAQILHETGYSIEDYLDFLEEQEIYYVSAVDENLVIYFTDSLQGIPHTIKEVTGDNAGHYIVTCYQ